MRIRILKGIEMLHQPHNGITRFRKRVLFYKDTILAFQSSNHPIYHQSVECFFSLFVLGETYGQDRSSDLR